MRIVPDVVAPDSSAVQFKIGDRKRTTKGRWESRAVATHQIRGRLHQDETVAWSLQTPYHCQISHRECMKAY